jgi:hypothetical protein
LHQLSNTGVSGRVEAWPLSPSTRLGSNLASGAVAIRTLASQQQLHTALQEVLLGAHGYPWRNSAVFAQSMAYVPSAIHTP